MALNSSQNYQTNFFRKVERRSLLGNVQHFYFYRSFLLLSPSSILDVSLCVHKQFFFIARKARFGSNTYESKTKVYYEGHIDKLNNRMLIN